MTGFLVFGSNNPITLRWRATDGDHISRDARLRRVSESRLTVLLPRLHDSSSGLAVGRPVMAEAGDNNGTYLARFKGVVKTIESRLIDIRLEGAVDLVQRRAHPRARLPFSFNTSVLLGDGEERYFLAHPLDIGAGGVRIYHRLPLKAGDRFRLILRPRRDLVLTPLAEVIESGVMEYPTPSRLPRPPAYATRARFVDLPDSYQGLLSRYVSWLLRQPSR
jgi:hypothetical protein